MERFHNFSELFFQLHLCAGVVSAVMVIAVIDKILQTLFQLSHIVPCCLNCMWYFDLCPSHAQH